MEQIDQHFQNSPPSQWWCRVLNQPHADRLQGVADVGGDRLQNRADVGAQELERPNREHRDQAQDERILDERLSLLVPLPQSVEQIDQHSKTHLLPLELAFLSLERDPRPVTG
jgi:hypothetical protein